MFELQFLCAIEQHRQTDILSVTSSVAASLSSCSFAFGVDGMVTEPQQQEHLQYIPY